MTTLSIIKQGVSDSLHYLLYSIIFGMLLWYFVPKILQVVDDTAGVLNASIGLLLLFSILSFMVLTLLCGWLLKYFLKQVGLPKIQLIVSQFKDLTLCQQFAFYWASFALLLLAAILSLIAVF